MNKKKPIEFLE